MNVKVDKLENNMAKLTVTIPAEDFAKAVTESYKRNLQCSKKRLEKRIKWFIEYKF